MFIKLTNYPHKTIFPEPNRWKIVLRICKEKKWHINAKINEYLNQLILENPIDEPK